jgi:hypothetical protein
MIARRTLLNNLALLSAIGVMPLVDMAPAMAEEWEEIPLWPGQAPGRGGVTGPEKLGGEGAGFGAVSNISTPRMRVYRPAKANGAAVIICGGGGYFRIQLWKESTPVARWLQARGFTVFELIYRLPNDGWDAEVPFMDARDEDRPHPGRRIWHRSAANRYHGFLRRRPPCRVHRIAAATPSVCRIRHI